MDPLARTDDPAVAASGPQGHGGHWRRERLREASLYLCTTARRDRGDLREFLHAAYDGGVDVIQLRDRSLATCEEIEALEVLAEVASEHGALFAVNDRADVAALVGADVLHVGQDDLTVGQARSLLGPDVIHGQSTHTPAQADDAARNRELDYFCTGPVWETPTKPGRPATGLGLVSRAADSGKVWFAIGGINGTTLPEVLAAGAGRAVVVRAITEAPDPREAAAALKALLRGR